MNIEIDEKEFCVIREIANNHHPNQREIAQKLGISVGLTNIIIKRLVRKGCIKIDQLNRRKLQYLLTPKGFKEKAKRSYHYTLKTIASIREMKMKIQRIVLEKSKGGNYRFAVFGEGELADLVEIALRELHSKGIAYRRVGGTEAIGSDEILLISEPHLGNHHVKGINIFEWLAEEVGR